VLLSGHDVVTLGGTEGVLRINNEAEVSSEILDVWTDSDKMPEDWSFDCEGCLFALVD
jgi:hypothetical protein